MSQYLIKILRNKSMVFNLLNIKYKMIKLKKYITIDKKILIYYLKFAIKKFLNITKKLVLLYIISSQLLKAIAVSLKIKRVKTKKEKIVLLLKTIFCIMAAIFVELSKKIDDPLKAYSLRLYSYWTMLFYILLGGEMTYGLIFVNDF